MKTASLEHHTEASIAMSPPPLLLHIEVAAIFALLSQGVTLSLQEPLWGSRSLPEQRAVIKL